MQAKLASYLGPHAFGQFSLVIAFYVIFSLFVDAGISKYVIKKVSEDKSGAQVYYGNFLLAQFFLGLVVFLFFLIIPRVLQYDPVVSKAMFVVGIGLFLSAMIQPSLAIIQAWQKIQIFAWITFVESLAKATWFLYGILTGKDLVFILLIYILVGVFDLLIYGVLTGKIATPKFIFKRSMIQSMFAFGIPFAMLSGFEILIAKVDSVIQKFFLPYSEIGQYAVAYRFLDFLTFLPAIVAISLFPYFSAEKDLETADTKAVINKINKIMVALAVPLGVGVSLFADKIIVTLFGDEYLRSIAAFRILIWATVVTLFYAVPNVIMQVKKTRAAIYILGATTAINVLANWILIPRYGILASAWLTVASYILAGLLYSYYSKKLVKFYLWRFAAWPAAAALVMGLILHQFRDLNIYVLVALAMLIYFGLLFAAGFLKREDLKFDEIINLNR